MGMGSVRNIVLTKVRVVKLAFGIGIENSIDGHGQG